MTALDMTGGNPHLLQYLWDAYVRHLDEQIKARAVAGQKVATLDEAKRRAPAAQFLVWAAGHLKDNRTVETFFVDGNAGLRLANNVLCVVCPEGESVRGTMQGGVDVPITRGASGAHGDGVAGDGGCMRI